MQNKDHFGHVMFYILQVLLFMQNIGDHDDDKLYVYQVLLTKKDKFDT